MKSMQEKILMESESNVIGDRAKIEVFVDDLADVKNKIETILGRHDDIIQNYQFGKEMGDAARQFLEELDRIAKEERSYLEKKGE